MGPLGLVPTMGDLHEGHLSLVRAARENEAPVAVSIFVNPTQFGASEDLSQYPRDLDRDLSLLESEEVELVWAPTEEEVYPETFQTWIDVEGVSQPLEGAYRPGHFRGVATVVAKLFNAFQPQRAYFGQKDAQQVVVIRRMTRDLNFPVEIVVSPTIREADGLAMSSRNSYLSMPERQAADVLFRALSSAEAAYKVGERDPDELRRLMKEILANEPLARPQYVSAADPLDLHELESGSERFLLSMAVFLGKTRLIDNVLLGNMPLGG
jgi:pantoate--beta-alanine ligase